MGRQDVLDNLGIEISPARMKCAMLSLETLRDAMSGRVEWTGHRRCLRSPASVRSHPAEAQDLIDQGAALLDTRENARVEAPDTCRRDSPAADRGRGRVEDVVPDKTKPVVIYCAAGARSMRAAIQLAQLGYQDVYSVAGGIGRWKAEGRPWELPERTRRQIATNPRYARHLVMPEVGPEGQGKLAAGEGAVHRCRWPGLAGPALSGGSGRRHDRHRRLRRRRPSATCSARSSTPKTASA